MQTQPAVSGKYKPKSRGTQPEKNTMGHFVYREEVVRSGISLGTALAIVLSWSVNKSVLWAIIHGILSWIYVVYYVIAY